MPEQPFPIGRQSWRKCRKCMSRIETYCRSPFRATCRSSTAIAKTQGVEAICSNRRQLRGCFTSEISRAEKLTGLRTPPGGAYCPPLFVFVSKVDIEPVQVRAHTKQVLS